MKKIMKTLIGEIAEALNRTVCQGWDRTFLESMHAQLLRLSPPTPRQQEVLHRVLDRCSTVQEERHAEWALVYETKHKEEALVLAHYHVKKSYFHEIAKTIIEGEVPQRRKFMRMLNNKYSQKVWSIYNTPPRLAVGTHVKARASFNRYSHVESVVKMDYERERAAVIRFEKYGAFIVGTERYVHSAARGAKRYRLLPPGTSIVFITEERFLKIMRR